MLKQLNYAAQLPIITNQPPQTNCDTFGDVSMLNRPEIRLSQPRGVSGFQTKNAPNLEQARLLKP